MSASVSLFPDLFARSYWGNRRYDFHFLNIMLLSQFFTLFFQFHQEISILSLPGWWCHLQSEAIARRNINCTSIVDDTTLTAESE